MLTRIALQDFAIVDRVEIEPGPGMNVFTGETGAGKSLVVTALALVLGDRAPAGAVRAGAERADLAMEFDVSGLPVVREWLQGHDLDRDGLCLLRRVIPREGRSRAYVNGVPMPLQALRELGEQLVDIHGQHAHQALLRPGMQRTVLDQYAGHETLLAELSEQFAAWRALQEAVETAAGRAREVRDRMELLRFQLQELERLGLRPGEYEDLDAEQRRLAHAETLRERCTAAALELYDAEGPTLYARLARLAADLREAAALHAPLAEAAETAEGLSIQAQELAVTLRDQAEALESDPERLAWLDERLQHIHDLARKYAVRPAELPALRDRIAAELEELESPRFDVAALRERLREAEAALDAACERLSDARREAAERLAQEATHHLAALGMPDARLEIHVAPGGPEARSARGWDAVHFHVRTNPGQPPGPLEKIASGGELSRLSLAIRLAALDALPIPTLVFDEVDTGIGGAVAEAVGERLRRLAEDRQVLCVTHLPQVAAQGQTHFHVAKERAPSGGVVTRCRWLAPGERVEEIARMLGGRKLTERARAHAREMLEGGGQPG